MAQRRASVVALSPLGDWRGQMLLGPRIQGTRQTRLGLDRLPAPAPNTLLPDFPPSPQSRRKDSTSLIEIPYKGGEWKLGESCQQPVRGQDVCEGAFKSLAPVSVPALTERRGFFFLNFGIA